MNHINPEYLSLADLLNKRLFTIPGYQRAYSWTAREREDLFDDIENIFQKGGDESHFMATIVCLHKGPKRLGTNKFNKLDIVDGQQRLTTLILLLSAIRLRLDPNRHDQEHDEKELSELLVKRQSDRLLLLQTNHDSSHHFADFLREGKAPSPKEGKTLADRELLDAIRSCQKFVEGWLDKKRELLDLLECVKNRLFFILHEVSDEKLVYTVFEVLNSRGIEVSWLDRLKSILMGKAFELENADQDELIKELHNLWRQIYEEIGLRQGLGTEALRFAATLYRSSSPSRPLSERDSVDEFRTEAHDAEAIRKVARWLLRVTEACVKVTSNHRQNAVTRISQSRLLAIAIHLRDDIESSDRHKLLRRWEKVSFRIYGMLRRDGRTAVGNYVRLAWRIVNEQKNVEEIDNEIRSIGKEFSIEEAVKALENTNCYEGWEDSLRYFMYRYEEHLTSKEGSKTLHEKWKLIWAARPADSIEHILPQGTTPDDFKHYLGNLMMLPPKENSRLQDKSPAQKLGAYRRTGLLSAGEVADFVEGGWSKETIEEREEKLLGWAEREWAG